MGPTGRRRRGGRKTAGLLALVLLAFLALGGAAASGLLPVGPGRTTGLSPTARPPATPSLTAVATPSPVASAEPSPSPSAVPTSPPTASPGRSSSPAASPTRTHIVQTGEWLSSIAEEYGTTVERLAELNDIDDPDVIDTGQVLVIPPVEEP